MDSRRVLFSGHSMGGHGALMAAVQISQRALGVASVSGWLCKETYGESNFLFEQSPNDLSSSHIEPALRAVLHAAIAENSIEMHLSNLAGLPCLLRVGAEDQTVPPFWAKRAMRLVQAGGGGGGKLSELAGKQHWWWDTARENDGGAMNDEEMRTFFASARGEWRSCVACLMWHGCGMSDGARASPAARAAELPEWPSSFSLRAFNPASFEGRAGWRLLQAHSPGRLLQLRGWRSRDTLHLQTRNLRRFHAPPEGLLTSGVVIDGQPLSPGVLEAAASANASGMN
ncbi:MAG: hypothetical protein SGPRY_001633 [Prymnesium sp.]